MFIIQLQIDEVVALFFGQCGVRQGNHMVHRRGEQVNLNESPRKHIAFIVKFKRYGHITGVIAR